MPWGRQKTGSVVCRSCGLLVGVNDEECYHCGARNPALWGFAPWLRGVGADLGFIQLVTGATILLYVISLALDPASIGMGGIFSMLSPGGESLFRLGAAGAIPVFGFGHWWSPLSAGWLHGGLLHIGLNLYWLYQVGPPAAELYGAGRMVIIYLGSSVVGFLLSSLAGLLLPGVPIIGGSQLTVGASAAIFGLFGAIVYSGRRGGSSAYSRQIQSLALILFLFGFVLGRIDNWAHAGGFAGGWLIARWLDPMQPERTNHQLAAVVGLGLSVLAVVVTFLTT